MNDWLEKKLNLVIFDLEVRPTAVDNGVIYQTADRKPVVMLFRYGRGSYLFDPATVS